MTTLSSALQLPASGVNVVRALMRSLRFMRSYRTIASTAVAAVLLASVADLIGPQFLRHIIDRGIVEGDPDAIWLGAAGLIGMSVLGGGATFLKGYLSARASHGAAFDMRNAIFDKLQRLGFSYHDRAETGQLITRVTSDVDLVREFVGTGLIQTVSAALLLVGAVTLLLMTDWVLALVAFTTVPATLTFLLLFVRRLGPMFRSFQQKLAALNSVLQENVAGVRVVKAFAREEYEAARYRRANDELLGQGLEVRRTVANAFPLLFSVGSIGAGFVTWAGAVKILNGTLTVGELVAFTSYLFLLLQPLFIIGFGAQSIARAGASAERLFEILDAAEELPVKEDPIELGALDGTVRFEHVSLHYAGDEHAVLNDVTFEIGSDTTVAVVGATGSGKTSLVSLIPRFYDATEGAVLIDGVDVRDVDLGSLRRAVGVVMQDSVLFSGSVRDNIAYGRPNATTEEVERAARIAQAHDFIGQLPHGYATRVGERGVKLSGGQRQRIAIARALLVNPRILIMDDSLSSVDAETEAALRMNLDALMQGRTTFIVAQRLSTVKRADTIVLMDAGSVVDIGTHAELLERSCLYAEIAASQLAKEGA